MDAAAIFSYNWAIAGAPCDEEEAPLTVRWTPSPTLRQKFGGGSAVDSASRAAFGAMQGLKYTQEAAANRLDFSRGFFARAYGAALITGESYCVMVTACTQGTEAVPGRCKNATSPLVRLGMSAPVSRVSLSSATFTEWPLRVKVSCEDTDSGSTSAYLSLGSTYDGADFLDALPLQVIRPDKTHTYGLRCYC